MKPKSPAQTTVFKGFAGMDNIHDDHELPNNVLRKAINTDVLDSGRLRRRKGSSLVLAIVGAHSMWGAGNDAYFIANDLLYRFFPNGTAVSLGAFVAGSNPTSYVKVNADIYLTCKTASARIRDGVMSAWGIEVPASPPSAVAGVGVMPPGTYHMAATYVHADGRESGASTLSSVVLAADGGITTMTMPDPLAVDISAKRLYITEPNGEVLYLAKEMGALDQFVTVGTLPEGNTLRTTYLTPPPFGQAVAHYNGRVFVVDAQDPSVLWFTDALDYDHVNRRKNYYQFGSEISVIAAVRDGLYVCADSTYFLPSAGADDAGQRFLLEIGAVRGTAASIPNTGNVIWMTEFGPAVGKDGGVIELIAEKSIASGSMVEAASLVREQNGIRQFIAVGAKQDSALQLGSYAEAEIVRRAN